MMSEAVMVWGVEKKMYLKLTDQQLKIITCIHVCVYIYKQNKYTHKGINLMVTTNLKSRIHKHTKKKRERERILT